MIVIRKVKKVSKSISLYRNDYERGRYKITPLYRSDLYSLKSLRYIEVILKG